MKASTTRASECETRPLLTFKQFLSCLDARERAEDCELEGVVESAESVKAMGFVSGYGEIRPHSVEKLIHKLRQLHASLEDDEKDWENANRTHYSQSGGSIIGKRNTNQSGDISFADIFTPSDVFIDLGSGLGRMVLQVHYCTEVGKAIGCELGKVRHGKALLSAEKIQRKLSFKTKDSNTTKDSIVDGLSTTVSSASEVAMPVESTTGEEMTKNGRQSSPPRSFLPSSLSFLHEDIMTTDLSEITIAFFASTLFEPQFFHKLAEKLLSHGRKLKYFILLNRLNLDQINGRAEFNILGRTRGFEHLATWNLPMSWTSSGGMCCYVYRKFDRYVSLSKKTSQETMSTFSRSKEPTLSRPASSSIMMSNNSTSRIFDRGTKSSLSASLDTSPLKASLDRFPSKSPFITRSLLKSTTTLIPLLEQKANLRSRTKG